MFFVEFVRFLKKFIEFVRFPVNYMKFVGFLSINYYLLQLKSISHQKINEPTEKKFAFSSNKPRCTEYERPGESQLDELNAILVVN